MPPDATIARLAAPPRDVPPDARVYLRPVGLVRGAVADAQVTAGRARRLAGGPFAFADGEVWVRRPGYLSAAVASIAEIERWAASAGGAVAADVTRLLDRLSRPRRRPDGGPLVRPLIMGIVNVTPDSFSDGGACLDPAAAVDRARRLAAAGADILDIGGESSRPGAEPVAASIELDRVRPVLERLAAIRSDLAGAMVSVDTRRALVMRAALALGVALINDVTALTGDPDSLAVAAGGDAAVVLMHMLGEPGTMSVAPAYTCAPLDVFDFLAAQVERCVAAGIGHQRIVVDPGIGFGKRGAHNLQILRALTLFHGLGCPIMLGLSRKGLTGELDRARPPAERLPGSLAATVAALGLGAQLFRVHDVAATRQAIDVWERLVGVTD
jgi:dihydropteroate synthase